MDAKAKSRAAKARTFDGYALCAWRDRLGLTQAEAARLIGSSRRSITRWENRLEQPVPRLVALACMGVEG